MGLNFSYRGRGTVFTQRRLKSPTSYYKVALPILGGHYMYRKAIAKGGNENE